MRISCHLLPIESGRNKKIPRVEKLCPLCNRSEIGDAITLFVEMYPLITFSYKGHLLGEPILDTNMSYKALFLYIMSMCDQNVLNLSSSYIENILNCYASEL